MNKKVFFCRPKTISITMKNVIIAQRNERDRLLARSYVKRQSHYSCEEMLASPLIKLITGPRRAGKSVFALQTLKSTNFAYLNFDDKLLLDHWDEDIVMGLLDEVYAGYKYLLLDEVQNLDGWDLWIGKLFRRGVNMVVTGSNARMLSSEMATVLTGRFIQIEILPFSLEETFRWNGLDIHNIKEEEQSRATIVADDYLHEGGFPETLAARQLGRNYLSTLFDSILLKDVSQRHKIRNTNDMYSIANYLLSNFCNPFTYNDLTKELGLSSIATTKKYCAYLHEPYLFFYLPRYNNKLKLMNKAAQKVYAVDNGLVASSAFNVSENLGRLLENQVFVELLRRGYNPEKSLFYYRSRNDREVDFVIRNGHQVGQLIQVCYDISSPKTRKRELDALTECAGELQCHNLLIITRAQEETVEHNGLTIHILPMERFFSDGRIS